MKNLKLEAGEAREQEVVLCCRKQLSGTISLQPTGAKDYRNHPGR
jgi:hypothetical protein